jgi:hypothetical protein
MDVQAGNLQPPQNGPRKRKSSTAIREQLESRKRTTSEGNEADKDEDNGDDGDEDNEADEDEVEMVKHMAAICIDMKKHREEKKERGIREGRWVPNIVKKVQHCTTCNARTEKGDKCQTCIRELCLDWLSKLQPEYTDIEVRV